jgi:hypothetical protein
MHVVYRVSRRTTQGPGLRGRRARRSAAKAWTAPHPLQRIVRPHSWPRHALFCSGNSSSRGDRALTWPCLAVYPRVPGLRQDTNEDRRPRYSPAAAVKPVQRPDVRRERRHCGHAIKLRLSRSTANLECAHAHAAHRTAPEMVRPRRPFATPAPAVQRGRPGSVCAARR